jgi:hypothetical protein
MLKANLPCMEGADARASAPEYQMVFVILFGCFGGW